MAASGSATAVSMTAGASGSQYASTASWRPSPSHAAARERSGPAISGWKRSSTSMRIEALATNIPAFHRYLPVARYSAAVCSSGFSTKAVTALATPSRPPVSM